MKLFIVLCLAAAASADFAEFQKKHGRKYKSTKDAQQAEVHYNRHKKMFDDHNAKFEAGEVSFTIGPNQFADQNNTELIASICKTIPPKNMRALPAVQAASTFPAGAASKDYTSWMQPVVNQMNCGCCWAHATVAQLESLYKRKSYNYVLSQQYLIDCSRTSPNSGCNGGWPATAMSDILKTGIPLATSYPFINAQATCKSPLPSFVNPKLPTQVNSYSLNGNETLLKNIVSQDGPVAIAMFASTLFMKYTSGIFYDSTCPNVCTVANAVNHGVVVVGYGSDGPGLDYWLVRNSWSTGWGINGYIKMARNKNNNCNVACNAMYMK